MTYPPTYQRRMVASRLPTRATLEHRAGSVWDAVEQPSPGELGSSPRPPCHRNVNWRLAYAARSISNLIHFAGRRGFMKGIRNPCHLRKCVTAISVRREAGKSIFPCAHNDFNVHDLFSFFWSFILEPAWLEAITRPFL